MNRTNDWLESVCCRSNKVALIVFFLLVGMLIAPRCFGTTLSEDPTMSTIRLMWQVPYDVSDNDLNQMKSAGITVIQHFNAPKWTDSQLRDYLDRAAAHGLRVILYVGSLLGHKGDEWALSEAGAEFIRKWMDHPALFAWHTFDEPIADDRRAFRQAQENVYNMVKTVDPKTPVMVSLNLTERRQWDEHFSEQAFDILEIHAYVNKGITKRQQNLLIYFTERRRGNYPVILSLRAFNGWNGREDLGPDGLKQQYKFFFERNQVTTNIGYYGWRLGKFIGISQAPELLSQFMETGSDHLKKMISNSEAPSLVNGGANQ